jgi:hypothetical protein
LNSTKQEIKIINKEEECIAFYKKLYAFESEAEKKKDGNTEHVIDREKNQRCHRLSTFMSPGIIAKVIRDYPKGKSPGPDNISNEILQVLIVKSKFFIKHIARIFQIIIDRGQTPVDWNESNIFLLPKKLDKALNIEHTRGIALTNIFRRIFEATMLKYIGNEEGWTRIHPNQSGFRRKQDTYANIIVCNDAHLYERNIQTFIDLKSAYDKVSINLLIKRLIQRGAPRNLINIIQSLFQNCFSRLIIDQDQTKTFKRERGLFQGSLLSPFLFNIFIDSLAQELQKEADKIETETTPSDNGQNPFKLPPINEGNNIWRCQQCKSIAMGFPAISRHVKS